MHVHSIRMHIDYPSKLLTAQTASFAANSNQKLFIPVVIFENTIALAINNSSNTIIYIKICFEYLQLCFIWCNGTFCYYCIYFRSFSNPNKSTDFLSPIQMKELITMNWIHAESKLMHNSIDINYYDDYILRIDCN